jgi:hypothetical protein
LLSLRRRWYLAARSTERIEDEQTTMSTTGLLQDIKPKSRDITITTSDGPQTIRASVYGPLAVNDTGNGYWMITHVPTGMAIHWYYDEYIARQVVRRLLALPIDWTSVTATSGIVNMDANTKAQIKEALK